MKNEQKKLYKDFEITSVCRKDLEDIGYDIANIDDGTMERLASKMADAYCDNGFWIDLPIIADYLEIPEKDERKCHLCDSIMVNKYCENTTCAEYQG